MTCISGSLQAVGSHIATLILSPRSTEPSPTGQWDLSPAQVLPQFGGVLSSGVSHILMKRPVDVFAFVFCAVFVVRTPDSYHRCCFPVSQGTCHIWRARLPSSQSCHLTPKIILLCPTCHQFPRRAARGVAASPHGPP